jgi:hypothetical protein
MGVCAVLLFSSDANLNPRPSLRFCVHTHVAVSGRACQTHRRARRKQGVKSERGIWDKDERSEVPSCRRERRVSVRAPADLPGAKRRKERADSFVGNRERARL